MGDPECQVILPRLKTDLVRIIKKVVENKLNEITIKWKDYKSMTIVLCSKGYPGKYKKNKIIKNLDKIKLSKNDFIYHAGTKSVGDNLFSIGGRVLNITSVGQNFLKIRQNIVSIIKKIKWNNGFYRKDIGWKIINKNANY
jgi:phosphoribosylamine--glycine ligase